jgi:hypothetical protein
MNQAYPIVSYSEKEGVLIVKITPSVSNFWKIITCVGSLVAWVSMPFVAYSITDGYAKIDWFLIVMVGFFLLLPIITFNYLQKIFSREVIMVSGFEIAIINRFLFGGTITRILRENIVDVKNAGTRVFTKHPLKGESMDYMGFGAEEKMIQQLAEDGNLLIRDNLGTEHRFGKDVYFDEADILISKIKVYLKWKDENVGSV